MGALQCSSSLNLLRNAHLLARSLDIPGSGLQLFATEDQSGDAVTPSNRYESRTPVVDQGLGVGGRLLLALCTFLLKSTQDKLISAAKSKLKPDGHVYYVGYAKFFGTDDNQCDDVTWVSRLRSLLNAVKGC